MSKLTIVSLNELFNLKLPKRDHIIHPFLSENGLMEIYALAGVGKTTFALSLAIAAATGTSFLHWAIEKPWRVLYIDGEMETTDMRDRISCISKSFDKNPEEIENFKFLSAYLNGGLLPDIGSSKAQETYNEVFDWADLIILDNISSLWLDSRENDADAWSPIRAWMSQIKASGRAMISVHHANKSGTSRGSSKRHDALDTVIRLMRPFEYEQEDGAVFEVQYEKSRGFAGKDAEPIGLKYSVVDGVAKWESFQIGLEKYEQVANLSKQGLTQQAIAEQIGLSQGEVSKRLGTAAKKGLL